MSSFFFNYYSVASFCIVCVYLSLFFILFSIPKRSMASHHFLIAIIGLITYHAGLIFFFSFDSPVTARIHWMLNAAPFVSIIHMNAFIVCYPGNNNPRVARWLLILQYLLAVLVMAWLIYHTWNSPAVFLFDGHAWEFGHPASSVNPIVPALACMLFLSILFLPLALWRIVQERGEERWWIAALLVLAIVTSAVPLLTFIMSFYGSMPRTTAYVVRTVFTNVTPYLFFLIYLSRTRDRTSSIGKLFGMSIAILSIVLMLSSYFALKDRDETYDALMREEARLAENGLASSPDIRYIAHYFPETALLHAPDFGNGTGPYLAMHTNEYENTVIYEEINGLPDRDFPNRLGTILNQGGQFFSGYKQAILAYAAGLQPEVKGNGQKVAGYLDGLKTSLGRDYAQISRLPENNFREAVKVYLAGADERLRPFIEAMISYMNLHSEEGRVLKEGVLHIVDKMEPAGVRNYRLGTDGRARYVAFLVHDARIGRLTEVGFSYKAYRLFVHEQAKNYIFLVAIILASCALGYPLIFSGMLVMPLLSLKQGVSRVAVGDLDTPLEVKNNDEFGDIAREFNLMISELKRHRDHLEEMVKERTVKLEEANKELEAFSYSVSHDLRAPLRHIDGFIELLQEQMGAGVDEKSRHYMATISDSARRMGMLIDDLLSFSRMGRQEMSKIQVDLGALVQEVIREFEPEMRGGTVHWQVANLPVVTGDRAMLRIVLVNLVSNALKFTRKCPQPEIEIGWEPGKGTEMTVFVRDNGMGFDMKYVDKLFVVFQRLHRSDEFEGTGIGLANVHRIISRHGGKTWAEGQMGQGATFYFSLPQPNKQGA
jgi:signal transduction histidine kinase